MSVTMHKITPPDAQTMQAVRAALAKAPKLALEPAARAAYDDLIAQSPAPASVRFEQGSVGGVAGWWCHPPRANAAAVTLYLHGGGYVIGSAAAYRSFVGHIAERAGCQVFIPDYSLAPERPFPSAGNDIHAIYQGLLALGYQRIALCGDSAGGGLALSFVLSNEAKADAIVGVAAMSPWIDLSVSGESMVSRAEKDPILSRDLLAAAAGLYLAGRSASDPRVATLVADLSALPPVRIDVGDAEVLLDDALRFARQAERAAVKCEVHVWEGMIHVFPSSFAILQAGAAAVADIGAFLAGRLAPVGETVGA